MNRLTGRNEKGDLMFMGKEVYAGDFYEAVSALEQYEDLQERGLLVRSPCRTGDIVYDISVIENTVSTLKILSVAITETNLRISWNTIGGKYDGMWGCSGLEIGKTTFFAREEAERALSLNLKGE